MKTTVRRPRQHDADLCDRIRELEERVRDLEARPNWYPYYVYPYQWPRYHPNWPNTITISNGTKWEPTTTVSYDKAYGNTTVASTYTANNTQLS